MTLQQLRYFIALGRHLHFGEAARTCFVSQPSLSQSIAELEKEIDVPLFSRNNRTVSLTPAGTVFYESAAEIIRMVDNAVIQAKRVNCGMSGHVKIGILGGLSATFPAKVKRFKDKYPNLDVELHIINMVNMHLDLLRGSIDIALTRKLNVENQSPQLDWVTLYQDRFCLVLHKDHPLAGSKHVNLSDFADDPFIFLSREVTPYTYNLTLDICVRRGFSPRIIYQASTLEELCLMLKAGMGCAIVPDCAATYGAEDLSFIAIEGEDTISDVVLAWNRNNTNSIIPLFLDELQDCYH